MKKALEGQASLFDLKPEPKKNQLDCACHSAICSPERCCIASQIQVGLSRIRCPKQ